MKTTEDAEDTEEWGAGSRFLTSFGMTKIIFEGQILCRNDKTRLVGNQREALDVPGKMVHGSAALLGGAGGGEDDRASGGEGEAY
jgi:hypothetical protein